MQFTRLGPRQVVPPILTFQGWWMRPFCASMQASPAVYDFHGTLEYALMCSIDVLQV